MLLVLLSLVLLVLTLSSLYDLCKVREGAYYGRLPAAHIGEDDVVAAHVGTPVGAATTAPAQADVSPAGPVKGLSFLPRPGAARSSVKRQAAISRTSGSTTTTTTTAAAAPGEEGKLSALESARRQLDMSRYEGTLICCGALY